MGDVNVLVVFYSRYGRTERLALAAGVGCIQAKANIRLRRVADRADRATIEADALWKETLERMKMDYIEPRSIDAEWADMIVLASPPDSPHEMLDYVATLPAVGTLDRKVAAPIVAEDASALAGLFAACRRAALPVAAESSSAPSDVAAARTYGRAVVERVRSALASHGGFGGAD
jgi:hypothetical protein